MYLCEHLWVYMSVWESMYNSSTQINSNTHKYTQNTLKYTQIHSNTLKYTQIHSNTQIHSTTNNIHRQSNTIKYTRTTQIHSNTLTYIQIHSNTLIYTHNIHIQCMFFEVLWVYLSVCECKCMYVLTVTPNYTQIPSNTLQNTQIQSKTLIYTQNIHIQCISVYVSVCECYECIWVYLSVSECM